MRHIPIPMTEAVKRKKRDKYEIGLSSVRGGNIVGEHEVIAGQDEVIEFKHTAYSKAVFVKGAVEAAKFLKGKPAGHYDTFDAPHEGGISQKSDATSITLTINDLGYDKMIEKSINPNIIQELAIIPEKNNTPPKSFLKVIKSQCCCF